MRKMKPEGQVRIPSGCAIAALISKDGNRLMLRGIGLTDTELQILGISHAGAQKNVEIKVKVCFNNAVRCQRCGIY